MQRASQENESESMTLPENENEKIKALYRYNREILYKKRKLTRADIELAMKNTRSNRAASKYLGVHYLTYKKYAKMFTDDNGVTLFELHKNQAGKGIKKYGIPQMKRIPLQDVLDNKHPTYHPVRLRNRLINEGLLPEKCANCGHQQRRVYDNKIPLILNFLDNDIHNYNIDNLELLCYNCYYHLVGNPLNPYKIYLFPRMIQLDRMDPDTKDILGD